MRGNIFTKLKFTPPLQLGTGGYEAPSDLWVSEAAPLTKVQSWLWGSQVADKKIIDHSMTP